MTIQELLNSTEHRPWKMPAGKWRYYQEWNRSIFLHWKVDADELKKFVPHELEIDLFNGEAWISLVAFTMEKIRPRNLPPFSPISDFDEINIRTYVKSNGKTGVYFLSIEGGKKLSCKIAKAMSELPYRYSKIIRGKNRYDAQNDFFNDELKINYEIKESLKNKSELDLWLTERYALFQDSKNHVNEFEIHHKEWELNRIEIKGLNVKYRRFEHLIDSDPDLSHYSPGVQVIAWDKIKRKRNIEL